MGKVDTVLRDDCHEINGIVAVQHLELNFVRYGTRIAVLSVLLGCANPAVCGTITHPNPPDPLLDGGPTTACTAGVGYAAGTDVNGRPIAPADVAAAPVPVPGNIAVPLHGGAMNPATGAGTGPYVSLDGKALDKLVNPPPCH
jgi:hypothetical protein